MLTIIEMPKLSATMEKGKVVKWLKKEGDHLEKGDILFEVETDKADVEVEAYTSGFLRKTLVDSGVEVPVTTAIAIMADSMEEDVSDFFKTQPPQVAVTGGETAPGVAHDPVVQPVTGGSAERKILISPLAKRMVKEYGIAVELITGTGPEGRITKEDIEKAVSERSGKAAAPMPAVEAVAAGLQPQTHPHASPSVIQKEEGVAEEASSGARPYVREVPPDSEDYEDMELTKMRKVIAQRLSESKRTAPHFYIDMSADATAVTQLKQDLEKKADQLGVKITFNDILVKLVAQVLKEFPMVNASYNGDRLRLQKSINIGVAVGMEEGLIVPVVKHVDQKSISQISRETRELADKARHKKLLPDEYSQGTFTITNLGMYGVETFHAIINPPESAILAVSSIFPQPVALNGEITVRPRMKLSLSVDHRVVDGVLAARFLGRLKELIETPYLLFV